MLWWTLIIKKTNIYIKNITKQMNESQILNKIHTHQHILHKNMYTDSHNSWYTHTHTPTPTHTHTNTHTLLHPSIVQYTFVNI